MKAKAPKIHLKEVDSPITDYKLLMAKCLITLRNAEPKFMFTGGFGEISSIIGVCKYCLREEDRGKRYIYGLVEGQAARDAGELLGEEADAN